VSQNARNHGGYVPVNLVEALATHAMTPEQALRKVRLNEANTGRQEQLTPHWLGDYVVVDDDDDDDDDGVSTLHP
jgi:hypothetical protein